MDDAKHKLIECGWFESNTGEPKKAIIYRVTGFSTDDICFVAYGGQVAEGTAWYLHWYRNGKRLVVPEGPYDSPEDALAAAVDCSS
jgi:hypothetical protein